MAPLIRLLPIFARIFHRSLIHVCPVSRTCEELRSIPHSSATHCESSSEATQPALLFFGPTPPRIFIIFIHISVVNSHCSLGFGSIIFIVFQAMNALFLFNEGNDPAAGAHVANALRAGNFQHNQFAAAERSRAAGGARPARESGAFRVAGAARAALRLDEHHVRRRSHLCLQGGEQP